MRTFGEIVTQSRRQAAELIAKSEKAPTHVKDEDELEFHVNRVNYLRERKVNAGL